jgi:hypothetical protein
MAALKKSPLAESSALGSGVHERLPRLQGAPDGEAEASTGLSDVVGELARLSDWSSSDWSSVPERTLAAWGDLDVGPEDAYVASLIAANVNINGIVAMSCLSEDDTLDALARLVILGLVTVPAR